LNIGFDTQDEAVHLKIVAYLTAAKAAVFAEVCPSGRIAYKIGGVASVSVE